MFKLFVVLLQFLPLTLADRPLAPVNVEWTKCRTYATVKWSPAAANESVQYYDVQYENFNVSHTEWVLGQRVNASITQVNISLPPFCNYVFRVVAYNEFGASNPSNRTTNVCTTLPDRPYTQPTNLRTRSDYYGQLFIEWTPLSSVEANGPGLYYALSIKSVLSPNNVFTVAIDDRLADHYVMTTGTAYEPSIISITAINALGESKLDRPTIVGYAYEDTPTIAPTNFMTEAIADTYTVFSWQFDSSEIGKNFTKIRGEFKGFKITLWELDLKLLTTREHIVDQKSIHNMTGNTYRARVDNLVPSSRFVAEVAVINNYSAGPPTESIHWTTLSGSSSPPSIYLQPSDYVYFREGESVILPCKAAGEPNPVYEWNRNDITFYPAGNDDRIHQLTGSGTLVFTMPEVQDEAMYQCFAKNTFGRSASRKFYLKQAKLQEFQSANATYLKAKLGEPLTLPCFIPESVPAPEVIWSIRNFNGGFEPVLFDAHVSVDREYRLRITNVKAEDARNGMPYACVAYNSNMMRMVTGPLYYIQPYGVEETKPVSYMWSDQDDRFGLLGSSISIKCIFSGNPTPDVFFERTDNKSMSERATKMHQELHFTNLQFEDGGLYECWGVNSVSTQRLLRQFNLRVNAKPYFLEEPQDTLVRVGTNAKFTCNATGVPTPSIEWLVNGVSLKVDPRTNGTRLKRPTENQIILENITLQDNMVFQCNASNIHGYGFADFYLKSIP